MTDFVLGSSSPGRRAMLRAAGLNFSVMPPRVDEDALRAELSARRGPPGPEALAAALAGAKAQEVSTRTKRPVLGADQILEMDGKIFTKPATLEEARRNLLALRGRTHRLISAAAVARDGEILWRHMETAELKMRRFSKDFLREYLAAEGEALLASVGCYRLEALGVQLFSRIRGDWFVILGLPLLPFLEWLRKEGILRR